MNELEQYQETMLAEISPLDETSRELLAAAESQTIVDDDDLRTGNELKGQINAHIKSVKDKRLALTRPIDDLKNILLSREKEILEPVTKAKAVLGQTILAYEEEQQRIRQAEERRIDGIVAEFDACYTVGMTLAQVAAAKAKAGKLRDALSESDREIPAIRLAVLNLSNTLKQREQDIEIESQRAKKKKLEDDEARIAREAQELEDRKERARIAEAELEVKKAEARSDRDRPKSNIVEVTEFEIIDPVEVPRFLCSPDEKLIRAHIKRTVREGDPADIIPGVRIFTTKKVR